MTAEEMFAKEDYFREESLHGDMFIYERNRDRIIISFDNIFKCFSIEDEISPDGVICIEREIYLAIQKYIEEQGW